MDPLPAALVLVAALLHATWNLIVKRGDDRLLAITLMSLFSGLIATAFLPFVAPPAAEAWPYLMASTVVHVVYKLFLARGYHHGDLGQVYPVARGSAPLIVALLAYLFVGEVLEGVQFLAVVLIAAGIIGLALRNGVPARREAWALFFAAGTAISIACYTVLDGIGARLSGAAISFALYLFVIEAIATGAVVLALRGGALVHYARRQWKPGLLSGIFSSSAYVLVVWALTRADMALVSALRETSVIFAALLGTVFLRETMGAWRISCAAVVALGLVLLHG